MAAYRFKEWQKNGEGKQAKQAETHYPENCSSDVGWDERGTGRNGCDGILFHGG